MTDQEKVVLKVEITMSKETLDDFWEQSKMFAKMILHIDPEEVDTIKVDEQITKLKNSSTWVNLLAELSTAHVMYQDSQMFNELGL